MSTVKPFTKATLQTMSTELTTMNAQANRDQSVQGDDTNLADIKAKITDALSTATDTTAQANLNKMLGDVTSLISLASDTSSTRGTAATNTQWAEMVSDLKTMIASYQGGDTTDTTDPTDANATESPLNAAVTKNLAVTSSDQTGGSGYTGDLNVASTSATYQGLTIPQLLASNSGIGTLMKGNPGLVSDIEKASAATGVPAGLLAAQAYAESSFGTNAVTTYDADGDATGGVMQLNQGYIDTYVPGGSIANQSDNVMAAAKAMAASYATTNSWGSALRAYNSTGIDGRIPDSNNLSDTGGAGTPDYVNKILGKHAMGLD